MTVKGPQIVAGKEGAGKQGRASVPAHSHLARPISIQGPLSSASTHYEYSTQAQRGEFSGPEFSRQECG